MNRRLCSLFSALLALSALPCFADSGSLNAEPAIQKAKVVRPIQACRLPAPEANVGQRDISLRPQIIGTLCATSADEALKQGHLLIEQNQQAEALALYRQVALRIIYQHNRPSDSEKALVAECLALLQRRGLRGEAQIVERWQKTQGMPADSHQPKP